MTIHAVKTEGDVLETECGISLGSGVIATGWGRRHRTYAPNVTCEDCNKALSAMLEMKA